MHSIIVPSTLIVLFSLLLFLPLHLDLLSTLNCTAQTCRIRFMPAVFSFFFIIHNNRALFTFFFFSLDPLYPSLNVVHITADYFCSIVTYHLSAQHLIISANSEIKYQRNFSFNFFYSQCCISLCSRRRVIPF